MSNNQTLGDRIARRISDIMNAKGLDPQVACRRYVAEGVLHGLKATAGMFIVNGGLIHPQHLRETGDADIKFIRRHTVQELKIAFERMRPGLLSNLGIRLQPVGDPSYIDMPNGVPGMKFRIAAGIGGANVVTHLDIGFGNSRKCAFPRKWDDELPGWLKGAPIYKGRVSKTETQVAEKLATILVRGATNTRLKDYADIAMMAPTLDRLFLIEEFVRVLEDRRLDPDLLTQVPEGLSLEMLGARAADWTAFKAKSRRNVDFDDTLCTIRHLYSEVRQAVAWKLATVGYEPEFTAPTLRAPKRPKQLMSLPASTSNVVDLQIYRMLTPGR